jgi:hypothetical protein
MHHNHTNTYASTTTTNMDYERLLAIKSGFLWTRTVCFGVALNESLVHAHDYEKQHHSLLERETQWMGRLGFVMQLI